LDVETLSRIPYVEPYYGFQISPDGRALSFSSNPTGQWEIYQVPIEGASLPKQITRGPGAKFNPRWSPDGRQLTCTLDLTGGEAFDILLLDLSTGEQTNLTPDTPDAIQPCYAWSPDAAQIALLSDRSGCFHTYILPLSGGPARLVLDLPYADWDVHWAPDGHHLAVVSQTEGQDHGVFIVPVDGGDVCAISDGGSRVPALTPSWALDGDRIAFASNTHGVYDLGIYNLATGQTTWVTEGRGEKEMPAWSPCGTRLVYVVSHGPTSNLVVLDLESGQQATYRVDEGVHYLPRFTPDGRFVAFLFDNPQHPTNLHLLSLDDGTIRPLTESLPAGLETDDFAMPEQVRYPSLDGQQVPALLYRPAASEEPPPAVIYAHGGPNWLTQITWDPVIQHMASRGWTVLAPNYRGSTGYGRDWQLANRLDLGGGDTQDLVAGADYLVRHGLADPARIAVTGASYGGYLTMTSLTQYPDRWAAGSAVIPFLNWFTEFANERPDLQQWDRENFGDPETDRELFYERSPFFFLDRIAAPVQLICGAHDPRCPASESVQARDELLAQGKACDFVLYDDEGHGFLKTENRVDAERRRIAFLAQALEPS
jgi:dipeptidyl aminopeptidase/acylaminoacyl peptidase